MKHPKEQGTWETHPCDLPYPPGPSAIGGVWRCNCGRRWLVRDICWDEGTSEWLGEWDEQDPILDEVDFAKLEQHANTRARRWRHR